MSIFDAVILGLIQGVTEFLPVSSSGHLILAREALGMSLEGSLAFDAVLHFATALAILVYFRRDLWGIVSRPKEHGVLLGALVLGTIPAGLIGFFFGDVITDATRSAGVVVWMLIAGSALFVLAELFSPRIFGSRTPKNAGDGITVGKGFLVGLYQAFALVPGVSRSGASIAGGMLFGLTREAAARFAFLLGAPILLGVGTLKLLLLSQTGFSGGLTASLVTGSLVAFFVGLGAIRFMISFLRAHSLYPFVIYRVVLAVLVFFLL